MAGSCESTVDSWPWQLQEELKRLGPITVFFSEKVAPLHIAASRGSARILTYLLEGGAKMDSTDRKEQTPLFLAASREHLETCQILLQHGANPNLKQINGKAGVVRRWSLAPREGYFEVGGVQTWWGAINEEALIGAQITGWKMSAIPSSEGVWREEYFLSSPNCLRTMHEVHCDPKFIPLSWHFLPFRNVLTLVSCNELLIHNKKPFWALLIFKNWSVFSLLCSWFFLLTTLDCLTDFDT